MIKSTYKVELIPEECCDYCHDIIHTHFEACPICHAKYAGTSCYGASWEEEVGDEISCLECNALFIIRKKMDDNFEYTLEHVEGK